jgi:hypothetical protein
MGQQGRKKGNSFGKREESTWEAHADKGLWSVALRGEKHVTKERQWGSTKCTPCSAHSLHGTDGAAAPFALLPSPSLFFV